MQLILLIITIGPTDCIPQDLFKSVRNIQSTALYYILKHSSNHFEPFQNPTKFLRKTSPSVTIFRKVAGVPQKVSRQIHVRYTCAQCIYELKTDHGRTLIFVSIRGQRDRSLIEELIKSRILV